MSEKKIVIFSTIFFSVILDNVDIDVHGHADLSNGVSLSNITVAITLDEADVSRISGSQNLLFQTKMAFAC